MKETGRCSQALAERIYHLDEQVYALSGSSLGRTLIGGKSKAVGILSREIELRPQSALVLDDLALISNMARTIPDSAARKRLLTEYNDILTELKQLETALDAHDIADRKRISLNPFAAGTKKFTTEDRLVICIGRTYGSAGTDIGFKLADDLHINYYDASVFKDVIERLQLRKELQEDENVENSLARLRQLRGIRLFTRNFNRFHGLPTEDALFFNQSQYIEDRSRQEDFVVMGRCADVILRNAGIPHVSIFITAPFEIRARRVMELHKLSYREACRTVHREDRKHARFYRRYTGYEWGNAVHYDLCINSASYGIAESEELIIRVIKARLRDDLAATAEKHEAALAAAALQAEQNQTAEKN